jgi:hypothetical protein
MATAKQEAINSLGKEDDYINLKGYNTERTKAQDRYNTDYASLQNAYNELLADAEANRQTAKTDFNTNRSTLNNNLYMATRGKTGADLSSRGLSKGFGSGGSFVANLQRNNANSNLANTYYDTMADIQKNINKGTTEHNYKVDSLKLDLEDTIANINAREAAARNAYRTAVAQLAEQIQARNDANDFAQKQLDALNAQIEAEKNNDLVARYTPQNKNNADELIKIANTIVSDGFVKVNDKSIDNVGDALNWLYNKGLYNPDDVKKYNKEQNKTTLGQKMMNSAQTYKNSKQTLGDWLKFYADIFK